MMYFKKLLVLLLIGGLALVVNNAEALTVHMKNCDELSEPNQGFWPRCPIMTYTCVRYDSPVVVIAGTPDEVLGTKMLCDNCGRTKADGTYVCCKGAGSKTCSQTLTVSDQTTYSVDLATEWKVSGGLLAKLVVDVEATLKAGWGWEGSTTRTLSFTHSRTVPECRKVGDEAYAAIEMNRKITVTHTYKRRRYSTHTICSNGDPCPYHPAVYRTAGQTESQGSGNYMSGDATSRLDVNESCPDPAEKNCE